MKEITFWTFADIFSRGIKPALWSNRFPTWAPLCQHPLPVPHFYIFNSRLLFPCWAEGWIQLVDVLCSEHFHVPISKWSTYDDCCLHLAWNIRVHFDSGFCTCKFYFVQYLWWFWYHLFVYLNCLVYDVFILLNCEVAKHFEQYGTLLKVHHNGLLHNHKGMTKSVMMFISQVIMMLVGGYFRIRDALPGPVWTYPLSYVAFHTYAIQARSLL